MKQFEKITKYPPELRGRLNSFIVTEFDDSMTVEMQLRVLIKWIMKNIDLTNEMVDYLNKFIETFDEKLYKTVSDVLNKWVSDGTMTDLINDEIFTDYMNYLYQLNQNKVDKGGVGQVTWDNLDTDVKEKIAGDSVAVVGDNSVTTDSIVDKSITFDKMVAKNKLYSIIPTDIRAWNTFKVSTVIGDKYIFNNTTNTLENTDDYFRTSVASYGTYTKPLVVPPKANGSVLKLVGTLNYRVSLISYDKNLVVNGTTEWANTIEYTIPYEAKYFVIAIKRYDNAPMKLEEVLTIDCGIYSEILDRFVVAYSTTDEKQVYGWLNGYPVQSHGNPLVRVDYSNYRMFSLFEVNPATIYYLESTLQLKYRYAISLYDENKTLLMDCGWATTKNKYTIRTSTETKYIGITIATLNDVAQIKDTERLDMHIRLKKENNTEIKQYYGIEDEAINLNNSVWFPCSIGKASTGKITTPLVTNRILTRFQVKKDTICSIKINASGNYRFAFWQVDSNNVYLHDTYWQVGGARIKNDVDGYIYIACYKLNADGSESDISIEEAKSFAINVYPSSKQNSLLEKPFKKKVICHRGASAIEPENTLPAFAKCGELGIWGCEIDLRYTKDGVGVCLHDATVDRTTDGTGNISAMTLEEVKALTVDFGQNIESHSDLKIPTFKEAIDVCRTYGTKPVIDIGILVENQSEELMDKIISDIEELGILEDCIVICQTTWIASSFRAKNSVTPMVAAYSGLIGDDLESRRLFRYENSYCGGWYLTTTTDKQFENLFKVGKRDYGLQFYFLTNDKEEAKKMLMLGCDFISSDDPYILNFE